MSVSNCIKIRVLGSESTGYLFKAGSCDTPFMISSKHGLCHQKASCEPFIAKTPGCCRHCAIQPNIHNLNLDYASATLEVKKLYSFPDKDLVLTEVIGNATHPLRIGEAENIASKTFYLNAFKENDIEPGRIMLNFPQFEHQGQIKFNIESNSTPDLIEKSRGYKGVSGGLVLEYPESDFPVAYAVIIENGKNNDLIAERLDDINYEVINEYFGCIVFHKPTWNIELDNSIKEYVDEIYRKELSEDLEIVAYIPSHSGFPHFNLNPIAKFLLVEFNHMLMRNNLLPEQSIARAGGLFMSHASFEPANKLLTGRLVETYLNAPHLYSTSLTAKNYHHMHYIISKEGKCELAFSNYCGANNLVEDLNGEIGKVVYNFNLYGFNQELFLERSFLKQKLPESDCETLFNIIFSGEKNIRSFCLVFTISLERYDRKEFSTINDYIISLVDVACGTIDENVLNALSFGLKLNLLIIPTNTVNELSETIVRELYGDD
ncbi:hypothetical protein LHL03_07440 [Pectobacterium carotovorum]|uniref:hypothetical protein n=1 Tax=Pectobacterium TaxID=122277 RepID=UPI000CD1C524|nr:MULTISPECIES: hypothetical protein [Pectobacterium]UCZ80956.1 hypothetical protein LHL03_07440 [Pectobacterium carotovorum]